MADALPGIELTDLPLARAVDLLAAVSTLPITLDPDAMRQLGVSPRDPISLRLDATTIGEALQAVAAKRGLAVTVDNGQVILTLPAEDRETLADGALHSLRSDRRRQGRRQRVCCIGEEIRGGGNVAGGWRSGNGRADRAAC